MNESSAPQEPVSRLSVFRNWISLTGLVIALGSVFSSALLFLIDTMSRGQNAYLGVLTYMVAPAFLMGGLALLFVGAWLRRRKLIKGADISPRIQIDLSRPRDRRLMGFFAGGAVIFMMMAAVGSYQTYHFTESVTFCGKACHSVMAPELTAYHNGSHARVACAECHIGSGAAWFVKAKLSGSYQVYSVFAKKYPTPIPTPIHNLRPALETCERCHWPKKFVGNLDRTFSYFMTDPTNTPFSARLLLRVGGSDPAHGSVGGIHWHINPENKIEYYAPDKSRQKIPWVRMTDAQGKVTEFRSPKFTNAPDASAIRTMDCIDCHNRPAHAFLDPNTAVNQAMHLERIPANLPSIKSNAVAVLTRPYTNQTQALQNIATVLAKAYPNEPRLASTVQAVQQIYTNNFFPTMKADWKGYPNNIGHMFWPGCFRCHDGSHKTADGKQSIKASDCTTCHVIVAQGTGPELDKLSAKGLEFKHPGGDLEPGGLCNECHDGTF